jgi:FkbM family methyltransferase
VLGVFKKHPVSQRLLRTRLGAFLRSTHGNCGYPGIALGWQLARFFVPRRHVHCDGVKFSLSCVNPITHFRWYLFPRKEEEVRQYINQYVKDGDIFFDIGANVGVFTVYCACRYPNTKVYSFEPEHSNLGLLKDNIIANHLTDRVTITSIGVSDFVGLSFLNVQDTSPGAAAHTEHRVPVAVTDEGYQVVWQEGIACATVDALSDHFKVVPNALKIDTDGNEDKILKGASRTLSNPTLRSLTLEMPAEEPKKSFCVDVLTKAGFVLTWEKPYTKNQIWVRK